MRKGQNFYFSEKLKTQKLYNVGHLKSCSENILRLSDNEIPKCINIFMKNKKDFDKSKGELMSYLNKDENEIKELFNSINDVLHFLYSGNVGFLSQDMTKPQIFKLHKSLLEEENPVVALNKLFNGIGENNFKLPEEGILYPDEEDQRNLFQRQLVIESISFRLSWEIKQQMDRYLLQTGSYSSTIISHLIDLNLPVFTELVDKERSRCIGLLQNETAMKNSDSYASTVVKFSAEKLAVITLQEIFRVIGKVILDKRKQLDDERVTNFEKSMCVIPIRTLVTDLANTIGKELLFDVNYQAYLRSDAKRKVDKSEYFKRFKKKYIYSHVLYRDIESLVPHSDLMKLAQCLVYYLKINLKYSMSKSGERLSNILKYQPIRKALNKKINTFILDDKFIDIFSKSLDEDDLKFIHMDRALPLVYKPAKWQDMDLGAYYSKPCLLVKFENNSIHERALRYSDMSKIYEVIEYLSNNPWKINKRLLAVVEKIWENGGNAAYMPERFGDNKAATKTFEFQRDESRNMKNKQFFQNEIQKQYDKLSLKSDFILKLQVARAFKDVGKIYFPQQMDFRGRVYPIPPHLNHIGNDLCRSLLIFSENKPLGKRGLRWLKIHLANKMGKDKLPMDDRVAYVDDNLALMEKILRDPVKNRDWEEFDDGWQALSIMQELDLALKSDFPEDFYSGMPIHQDGTCNGLQHYAALGRDFDGAFEVNLVDRDKPGDIYTKVCSLVIEKLKKEVETNQNEKADLSNELLTIIKRKVVKQTVMTTVYGVTFIGAKDQIKKQLREYIADIDTLNKASIFLAKLTLESVGDLFNSANKIKSWLISCAEKMSKQGEPVSWITPLGFPATQPYRREENISNYIETTSKIKNFSHFEDTKIHVMKQKTAFPPNFVHSMDSTHMMLTALRMKEKGLNFASVHDSFWTHAIDLDVMNIELREQFVSLYSGNVLEGLKESFENRFPDLQFEEIPEKGNLDLNNILTSTYFFS